jgi:hypothetical protein
MSKRQKHEFITQIVRYKFAMFGITRLFSYKLKLLCLCVWSELLQMWVHSIHVTRLVVEFNPLAVAFVNS